MTRQFGVLALCLLASPATAQVARLDTAASTGASSTLTFTVGAGSNRILIAAATQEGGSQQTVTYGDQSMTVVGSVVQGAERIDVYQCDEACITAATGANVGVGGSPTCLAIHAASYSGVDQTTPIPETNSDTAAASTPNPITDFAINAGTNSGVVAVAMSGVAGTTTWANVTEQTDQQDGCATSTSSLADTLSAGGGTIDPEPTFTSQNVAAGFSLELMESGGAPPASGGTGGLMLLGAGR